MKKIAALLLALMFGMTLVACGDKNKQDEKVSQTDVVAGGWTEPESTDVTDEVKNLLNKATAKLAGGTYEPVAYLGSQVVAGTNHRILCKFTPATQDPTPTYAIVTVYEDLEGNAEIIEILHSEAEVNVTDVVFDGGWFAPETTKVPKEAVDALVNASANVVGASYHPVALLGTQVVAGINFCMLCEVTPATENPEPHYAIVIAGQGVNGATYTLQTYDFTAEDAE